MRVTECECESPGWCERHQCNKPAAMFLLCRTRQEYFQLWEEGTGPGQNVAAKRAARKMPCVYKGANVRTQNCPSCKGRVRISVFQCSVHVECTVAKNLDGIACCARCDDYVAGASNDETPVQKSHGKE